MDKLVMGIAVIAAIIITALVVGAGILAMFFWDWNGGPTTYKDIHTATIPASCAEHKNDTCELFDCMVDSCWCYDAPDEAVLKEGNTIIQTEGQAAQAVIEYLREEGETPELKKAVKLNNVFYNVFVEYEDGEDVYTIAADGTIMTTTCGV